MTFNSMRPPHTSDYYQHTTRLIDYFTRQAVERFAKRSGMDVAEADTDGFRYPWRLELSTGGGEWAIVLYPLNKRLVIWRERRQWNRVWPYFAAELNHTVVTVPIIMRVLRQCEVFHSPLDPSRKEPADLPSTVE